MSDKEKRLDELREEARRSGRVKGSGTRAVGGPLPPEETLEERVGYYGRPVIKPPVWTWEVPLYFFVGGLAGGGAILALAALLFAPDLALVRIALGLAFVCGAVVSPILLILDLGRPKRFIYMLRVFKPGSPMSVGTWILSTFALAVTAALVLALFFGHALAPGVPSSFFGFVFLALVAAGALLGAALATYTGVLIGATTVPAWHLHHRLLPLHFGVAGLGSAAAATELLGFHQPATHALGLAAATIELLLGLWLELRRHGAADRALRRGRPGLQLRTAAVLTGPVALGLRLAGLWPLAAIAFLLGALLSRYGWLAAGRVSARDPEALFTAQR